MVSGLKHIRTMKQVIKKHLTFTLFNVLPVEAYLSCYDNSVHGRKKPFLTQSSNFSGCYKCHFPNGDNIKGGKKNTSGILLRIHLNSLFSGFRYAFNTNLSKSYLPSHKEAQVGSVATKLWEPLCGSARCREEGGRCMPAQVDRVC